jgi:prepilin-type N-terminal cleavage/methylation domain-containing protein/prepilin-type processing-associated H-X9-DG protein
MHTRPRTHIVGFTLVELLVVIGIIALLISILLPTLSGARERANRVKCAANLRSIGQAMHEYATENHGQYPRTRFNGVGDGPRFFFCDGTGPPFGTRSNGSPMVGSPQDNDLTAAYFLLIHYKFVPPDAFVCPSTDYEKDPLLRVGDPPSKRDAALRSNFIITDPLGKDFSYSFSNPYPGPVDAVLNHPPISQHRPTDPADLALAADRNDGQRWNTLDPDAGQAKIQPMNSSNHKRKGQNVLFNDGHVSWEDTPFCGHGRDNIYTRSTLPGVNLDIAADRYDSLLSPMFPLKNQSGSQ